MIGVVTGMVAEVAAMGAWAGRPEVQVAVSGARPAQAEAEARRLVAEGAELLVSWGLAGGLARDVAAGVVIRPGAVLLPDGTRVELERGMRGDVAIAGSETVVASVADKAALRERTGAIAVDMESHLLAQVSLETGVGLVIVRAVSDPWDRALPGFVGEALGPDGRPRIGRVLAGLARRPWALPDLLAAKRDSDRALIALSAEADQVFGGLVHRLGH
ncbi:MAG: hypothetical protein AAGK00_02670 [Pseudomonadota bacterium]